MIYIKAIVKGEPDVPPFTKVFQYSDATDELILQHSVQAARDKLDRNMRLNVNEALLLYTHLVAAQLRAKKSASKIEESAKTLLSPGQVMVGVPETLRTIRFDAIVDGRREWLTLKEPMQTSAYVMANR
jgi:urease subunit gamma